MDCGAAVLGRDEIKYMKKKTSMIIFLTVCAVFLTVEIVFLICGFGLPEQFGDTFMGELKYKCAHLEETEGQRIVIVGGSGVAFGYDCRLIEETLKKYKAVNFGMYAGLGSKAVLDLSEVRIRAGDIVILSPEQDAQTLSDYFNGEYMWQAADGDFGLLTDLKRENLEQMLGAFPGFVLQKLRYVMEGKRPNTDDIYCRSSFNEYGDIESDQCTENTMPFGYDSNQTVRFAEDVLQEEFIQYMNDYAERLEKKGAVVWYRFCPVNELAVEESEDVESYYELLKSKLDFPIIGNPNNSVMEAEWFFDTNFHLNSSGKTVNTVCLIRDIKAMLGDDSSVEIALPEKPGRVWGNAKEVEKIWKAGESAGDSEVEKIVVPEEITLIEDYAFVGCTNLKKIIIKQKDPAECMVGQHLLDGTKARIYVPEGAVDDYRLNYSWAAYADRIVGYESHSILPDID